MTDHPRFTFCIPNLNKIDFLPACIESMLAQDSDDWCCVFVDGFSTDGCWEYMQRFADDPRFRLRRGLRQGMYADWNECLRQVETEYFYILTSDDTCYPELVSQTTQVLNQYLDVDVCHFQYELIDRAGNILSGYESLTKLWFPIYSDFVNGSYRRSGLCEVLSHYAYGTIYKTITSLVFRTKLLQKMGKFSTDYGSVGDYDWGLRLGLYSDVIYIPQRLATWRTYGEQATAQLSFSEIPERFLEIAKRNIKYLNLADRAAIGNFDAQLLLFQWREAAARGNLVEAKHSRNLVEMVKHLSKSLKASPLFILKELVRQVSGRRLGDFTATDQLCKMITAYELQWPPQPIDVITLIPYDLEVVR
jgi:glycosyltransferase involved in cell wall biosynthesis